MSVGICSRFASRNEETESGTQQSHCESCVAAQLRTRFSQWLPVLRKAAAANGARRGRGMHERDSLRLPFARRPTDLIAHGGTAQMRAHAVARLWRTGPSSRNEGALS